MCFQHQIAWHEGQTCDDYTREQDDAVARESVAFIKEHTKPCPRCFVNIEKGEWCFHMICRSRSAPQTSLPQGADGRGAFSLLTSGLPLVSQVRSARTSFVGCVSPTGRPSPPGAIRSTRLLTSLAAGSAMPLTSQTPTNSMASTFNRRSRVTSSNNSGGGDDSSSRDRQVGAAS